MAEIQVAAVFSDNMVLQRNKIINIFGWIDWEEKKKEIFVKAELFNKNGDLLGENTRIYTNPVKKWVISLPSQEAQEECSLKIWLNQSTEAIVFSNIAIGEVWLAGGQSNMEFELGNCTEGPQELADTSGESGAKNVRF